MPSTFYWSSSLNAPLSYFIFPLKCTTTSFPSASLQENLDLTKELDLTCRALSETDKEGELWDISWSNKWQNWCYYNNWSLHHIKTRFYCSCLIKFCSFHIVWFLFDLLLVAQNLIVRSWDIATSTISNFAFLFFLFSKPSFSVSTQCAISQQSLVLTFKPGQIFSKQQLWNFICF